MEKMNDILDILTSDYGKLWSSTVRGNTLEIETPMFTANDQFITIFITTRGDDYIVTDGGYIFDDEYLDEFESYNRISEYDMILDYYLKSFRVEEWKENNKIYYFKRTSKKELLSKAVLELSTFISSVINVASFSVMEKEKLSSKKFDTTVKRFFITEYGHKYVYSNYRPDKSIPECTFSVGLEKKGKITLINGVTGGRPMFFQKNLGFSNIKFQLIRKSPLSNLIERNVTILDDRSNGYENSKHFVDLVKKDSETEIYNWSDTAELKSLAV